MAEKKHSGIGRVRAFNICVCQSCVGLPEFENTEMVKHLKEVHGIDLATTKFNRDMLLHMDFDKWYESQYQWTEQGGSGVKFRQFVREARKKEDR